MSKYIKCYCPVCDKETLHEIYIQDTWTKERTDVFERVFSGIFTLGFALTDYKKVCECTDCKHIK